MRAPRAAIVFVLLALFWTSGEQVTHAQSISIESDVAYRFGESIRLSVRVEQAPTITRAAVFLRPESSDTSRVILATLATQDPGLAEVEVDPAQFSIFAFETLFYWWQIDFDTGEVVTTDVMQLEYADDRFSWQSRSVGDVSVRWHDRSLSEGQAILETTQFALGQIAQAFALGQTAPLRIIIYNSTQELRSALSNVGLSHTTGHAEPDLGIILISVSGGAQGLVELERLIPHELVHLLLEQSSPSDSVQYPAWLSEGMATMVEGAPSPANRTSLDTALHSGELLRFVDLCTTFPISAGEAQLAYAQSASFLRYIVDVYGVGGIHQLLGAYQEGTSCTGGVQRVFQRSLDQLQSEWQAATMETPPSRAYLVWTGALALLVLVALGFYLRRHRGSSTLAKPSGEEMSE